MSRLRPVTALVALTFALLTAGCTPSPTATDPATAPAAASSTPAPSPVVTVAMPTISAPEVDPATLDTFSKSDVAAGWKAATDLSAEYAFNPSLMDKTPGQVRAPDFEGVRARMTASARKDFDGIVAKLPEAKAVANVNGIALHGLNKDGYTMNRESPVSGYVIDGSVSPAKSGQMKTTLRQRAVLHMLDPKGEKIKVTVSKTITFFMQDSGGKWQINGWRSEGTTSSASPDN